MYYFWIMYIVTRTHNFDEQMNTPMKNNRQIIQMRAKNFKIVDASMKVNAVD